MATAVFYNIAKKPNSTYRPASGGTTIYYMLKGPCSILSPVLRIDRASLSFNYNYCFLESFGRFYFVDDITLDGPVMYVSLRVDVLASWKTSIGVSSHYILRAASEYNGVITDMMYPITSQITKDYISINSPYGTRIAEGSGYYSIGINGSGGVQYYLMGPTQLQAFLYYLLSDLYAIDAIGELQLATNPQLKMLVDPLQYITSLVWIPTPNPSVGSQTAVSVIRVGYVDVSVTAAYRIDQNVHAMIFAFNNIPRHPQAPVRGDYLNRAPFSRYELFLPPFGKISLDPADIAYANSFGAVNNIDLRTGTSTLTMIAYKGTAQSQIAYTIGQVRGQTGVPVALSQVLSPGWGAAQLAGPMLGAAAAAVSGNYSGAIAGMFSAIDDATKAQIPTTNTVGSTGSFDSLVGNIMFEATFSLVAADDNAERGRPVCGVRQISTLSGFVMCADVQVSITGATAGECEQIKQLMESGFFYE